LRLTVTFARTRTANGNLYNEPRAAIEITVSIARIDPQRATLVTSGPAASVTAGQAGKRLSLGETLPRAYSAAMKRSEGSSLQRIPAIGKRKDEKGATRFESRRHRPELAGRTGALVARQTNHRHNHTGHSRL